MLKKACKYYLVAIGVLSLDQIFKLWVHFYMKMGACGQIKLIGNWFKLLYTLNPGMAFGIQFGFSCDKIVLTIIRIIAIIFIIRYIWRLARTEYIQHSLQGCGEKVPNIREDLALYTPPWHKKSFIYGWALVLGGAAGNGIDSIFYGKLLKNAPLNAPTPWLSGQVIDMLYIDIWSGKLPHWMPFFGNKFVSCLPIFNLADVAILAGIALVVLSSNQLQPTTLAEAEKEEEDIDQLTEKTIFVENIPNTQILYEAVEEIRDKEY